MAKDNIVDLDEKALIYGKTVAATEALQKKHDAMSADIKKMEDRKAALETSNMQAAAALEETQRKLKAKEKELVDAEKEEVAGAKKEKAEAEKAQKGLKEAQAEFQKAVEDLEARETDLIKREQEMDKRAEKALESENRAKEKLAAAKDELKLLKEEEKAMETRNKERQSQDSQLGQRERDVAAKEKQVQGLLATVRDEQKSLNKSIEELTALQNKGEKRAEVEAKMLKKLEQFCVLGKELKTFIVQNVQNKDAIENMITVRLPELDPKKEVKEAVDEAVAADEKKAAEQKVPAVDSKAEKKVK